MNTVAGIVFLALIAITHATSVRHCNQEKPDQQSESSTDEVESPTDGRSIDPTEVEISGCQKAPCRLKQGTKVAVAINLKPEYNVTSLKNSVAATILGVPLPFIGVDDTDACPNIFKEGGDLPTGCPLVAGEKYIYKNAFDVLRLYPRIKVDVRWALTDPNTNKNVHCFDVLSKIVA